MLGVRAKSQMATALRWLCFVAWLAVDGCGSRPGVSAPSQGSDTQAPGYGHVLDELSEPAAGERFTKGRRRVIDRVRADVRGGNCDAVARFMARPEMFERKDWYFGAERAFVDALAAEQVPLTGPLSPPVRDALQRIARVGKTHGARAIAAIRLLDVEPDVAKDRLLAIYATNGVSTWSTNWAAKAEEVKVGVWLRKMLVTVPDELHNVGDVAALLDGRYELTKDETLVRLFQAGKLYNETLRSLVESRDLQTLSLLYQETARRRALAKQCWERAASLPDVPALFGGPEDVSGNCEKVPP